MYLKIGEEFADGEFQLLSELLAILDGEILRVQKMIRTSDNPDAEGLTDRGEYFIGVGLTAVQQYLTDTLAQTGISKKTALEIGPRYSSENTFVGVVNAAANWWKHSAEWSSQSAERADALRTQQIITDVTGSADYALSNVLSNLLGSENVSLGSLVPNLVLWRTAVDESRVRNA